jgi:hypothetical protein
VSTPHSSTGFLATIAKPEYVFLLLLILSEVYLISSSNGFYKIDEGMHFIDDYSALQRPSVSIGIWQRFGSVWLFALPAQLGHKMLKVFASLLFLATVFFAYKVAEVEQIRHRGWIVALAGFQPVFLDISFTCLAELPAALLLILSYYLYRTSRWKSSVAVASLVFLFRFEMSILAVFIVLAALVKKKYSVLPFALLGPFLWLAFSVVWTGDPLWLLHQFMSFGHLVKYTSGTTWDHYLKYSTDIFGNVQVCLLVLAMIFAVIDRRIRLPLVWLTVIWCLLLNSLASNKSLNWTGSVGDFRYLAPVAPFVGLLALDGLARFMDVVRNIALSRYLPLCLAIVAFHKCYATVQPHRLIPYEETVIALTQRAASDPARLPILSNHWASTFALMEDKSQVGRIHPLTYEEYVKYPREYILWDTEIANSPFSQQALTLGRVETDPKVSLIDSASLDYGTVYLYLKDAAEKERRE